MNHVVIGCGTGRCGTMSLARLLNGCLGVTCTHERRPVLPWQFSERLFEQRVEALLGVKGIVGDVCFSYLPYLEALLERVSGLSVLCLMRDRGQTVESFERATVDSNHWMNHDGSKWCHRPGWDECFPTYDVDNKHDALMLYWYEYTERITQIKLLYPDRVTIVPLDYINDNQDYIFDAAGIPDGQRIYKDNCHYNGGVYAQPV